MRKFAYIAVASSLLFMACTNSRKEAELAKQQEIERQAIAKAIKDSLQLDSFKKVEDAKVLAAKEAAEAERAALAAKRTRNSSIRPAYNSSSSTQRESAYAGQQQSTKKQGWSDAAKGAVIGAAAGAVGGAIIDKKKGRGAIIGGVVGGGTGYVIGRQQDKKSGRAN